MTSIVALFLVSILCFAFYNTIISAFLNPFEQTLYITQIEQGFTTKIKVSIYLGLIVSFPIHLYNVVIFIIPALTTRERSTLSYFLGGSSVLLLCGVYTAYFQILPISIRFLQGSSFVPENVVLWLNYRESLLFVFQLVLAFVALFQLPLVLLLLMMLNVVDRESLHKSSRYFIILIFLTSAMVTPPDVVSQLGLAVPLIILFYLTIFVAKLFNFGERRT